MGKKEPDIKYFLIRIGVTLASIILIMYLAKTWFIDKRPVRLPRRDMETVNNLESNPESQILNDYISKISWRDADKHYGEYVTVEGTIVVTHNSGRACFLNFHPNYKRYFSAVIFASDFSRFPNDPENYYNNKKVRVSGYIKEYKGKPEIILRNPNQIKIIE